MVVDYCADYRHVATAANKKQASGQLRNKLVFLPVRNMSVWILCVCLTLF